MRPSVPPLNELVSPAGTRMCTRRRSRRRRPCGWDQGFESAFLQRGVKCEPDFLDQEAVSQRSFPRGGPRVRILLPPAKSLRTIGSLAAASAAATGSYRREENWRTYVLASQSTLSRSSLAGPSGRKTSPGFSTSSTRSPGFVPANSRKGLDSRRLHRPIKCSYS